MQIVFVSNYINHHQIPFCDAMYEKTNQSFTFIQTEPMEAERVQMGWQEECKKPYVHLFYEETEWCRNLIRESDVVLFGGCDDESYIVERLRLGRPIIRISERLYKTGQWKAVSPRGLLKKYKDHTKYRKAPVYLLCAGAYVASDFHIVRAYPHKMFCWGYFPETKHYDVDKLLNEKGWTNDDGEKVPYLLWAARFIDWKHPDLPLRTAYFLKKTGQKFHMDIVGGGALEDEVKILWQKFQLEDCVTLVGYQTPEQVRERMEKADIFLQTSDREEGWGAVANEAMNSACALVSNHMIGAAPYLIKQGENGFLYQDKDAYMLHHTVHELVKNKELCRKVGKNAYQTITEVWNAENAANCLMELIENGVLASDEEMSGLAPCVPAPVIAERKMWKKLMRKD